MIEEARLLGALGAVVKRAEVDAISVCAHTSARRVLRFAHEAIHQAVAQETVTVTVHVMHRRRRGVASADTLDAASLARCAKTAKTIAQHAPVLAPLPSLPQRHRARTRADHVAATVRMTPRACVTSLRRLVHLCQGAGASLAGSMLLGEDAFAVVNSAGVSCYAASTVAAAKLVTMYRKLSGFASAVHRDVRQLDLEGLLRRSLSQSLHRQDPVTLPLGSYEVILEPEAVADLVTWLGYTAFGAKSVEERTSCLAGRMGERLFAPSVTIYDDGSDPKSLRMPFDFEGTPKQKVVLIDRGRAAGIVYDTTYGARFDHPSTGHGMPPNETEGPFPLHLGMAAGTTSVAAMIRACRRGLLIPRFHYVNGLLNPREALMTGLTREGTFLIERGRVTSPVATMRFTQSLLDAFSRVLGVSSQRRLIADPNQELGCAVMPALHLAKLSLTGRSES